MVEVLQSCLNSHTLIFQYGNLDIDCLVEKLTPNGKEECDKVRKS